MNSAIHGWVSGARCGELVGRGGSQANALEEVAGDCTADRATFDWAEFSCDAARFRFEFTMRVEPLTGVVDSPDSPEGSHELALGPSSVDGVRLTVVAWMPPSLPPERQPGDSTRAGR